MAYSNGRIPAKALDTTYLYYPGTGNGRQTLKSVAPYAEAMATEFYLEFGKPLEATDGYRDYATQVTLKRQKGVYAATPGTSNHGWGKAFDLASGVNSFSSKEHKWLRANAHRWGFVHPTWAHDGNSANGMDEAWHWEYVGGGSSKGRVLRARSGRGEVGLGHTNKAKVREIQERLNYHLPADQHIVVDGDFGLGTAIAVIRFQKLRRAYVSGRVSLALLARLRRDEDTTRYERALRRLRARRARAKARKSAAREEARARHARAKARKERAGK